MSRSHPILVVACSCVLAVGASLLAGQGLAFRVGAAALGIAEKAELAAEMRDVLCMRLDARDGIAAVADAHTEWNGPPRNANPEAWLSVVLVEVGGNLDLLALRWGKDGSVASAARRPALERPYAGVFPFAIPPGPQQIPRNAAIELAAQTGRSLSQESRPAPARPPLAIAIKAHEPEEAATGGIEGVAEGPQDEGSDGSFAKLHDRTVEAASVLALAAAWEAGWRPSLKEKTAGDRATLTLVGRTQALDIQCKAVVSRVESQHALHRVPEGEFYPYLLRLFRKLKEWGPQVQEFAKVTPPRHRMRPLPPGQADGYQVLAWHEGILAILTEGEQPKLTGLNVATGQPKWTVAEEAEYVSLTGPENRPILICTGRKIGLSRVVFADGSIEEVLKPAGDGRLAIDFEARDAVFVKGRGIVAYVAGTKAWEASTPLPVGMDSLLTRSHVVVGSDDQVVRCYARPSGALRWTRLLEGRPATGSALPDDALVIGTQEGGLYALAESDGAVRWKRDLADGLLQPPCLTGEKLLVVDGSGTIGLLEPSTGKSVAERRLTGRLVGATPAPEGAKAIAVAERAGRVTLLAGPTLETISEVALQARLHRPPLAARNVPSAWCAATPEDLEAGIVSEHVESAFLVIDEDGFVYVLPSAKR